MRMMFTIGSKLVHLLNTIVQYYIWVYTHLSISPSQLIKFMATKQCNFRVLLPAVCTVWLTSCHGAPTGMQCMFMWCLSSVVWVLTQTSSNWFKPLQSALLGKDPNVHGHPEYRKTPSAFLSLLLTACKTKIQQ